MQTLIKTDKSSLNLFDIDETKSEDLLEILELVRKI